VLSLDHARHARRRCPHTHTHTHTHTRTRTRTHPKHAHATRSLPWWKFILVFFSVYVVMLPHPPALSVTHTPTPAPQPPLVEVHPGVLLRVRRHVLRLCAHLLGDADGLHARRRRQARGGSRRTRMQLPCRQSAKGVRARAAAAHAARRPRSARSFAHALWVSSRTASTLGFTNIYPNPDCVGPNLTVMLQARGGAGGRTEPARGAGDSQRRPPAAGGAAEARCNQTTVRPLHMRVYHSMQHHSNAGHLLLAA
jgi:hypothetical protein